MYEHRGYYDHANTLLTHGKCKDDLFVVVYFCPIKDSLLNGFSVKARVIQSLAIPIEFFQCIKNSDFCDQLEPPICVLAFLGALLHDNKFSTFPRIVIKSDFVHSKCDFSNKVLFSNA